MVVFLNYNNIKTVKVLKLKEVYIMCILYYNQWRRMVFFLGSAEN